MHSADVSTLRLTPGLIRTVNMDGAARWAIYRDLRDFIPLHGRYSITIVYSSYRSGVIDFPELPRASPPLVKYRTCC